MFSGLLISAEPLKFFFKNFYGKSSIRKQAFHPPPPSFSFTLEITQLHFTDILVLKKKKKI